MALYLSQTDLDALFDGALVTAADCVAAVAASFREQGEQSVGVLPRQILFEDPEQDQPASRALKLSAAYMRGSRVMGASVYAVHYQPGSVDMWLMVFCGVTGKMLGVINSKSLSIWKTAATAAVAAQCLARSDARTAALIGTGSYALAQLTFLAAVTKLKAIRCFSRDVLALRRFCEAASRRLDLPVEPANSARAAVEGADIVTTITTSGVPVLMGDWLSEGVHCNVMGQHAPRSREVDSKAVADCRVFVDSLAQAMQEKGELLIPIDEGTITPEHVVGELGAVLAGRCAGRTNASEKTMFCSGGTAFEYMGLCRMLLERAAAAGVGQRLSH
ncbi:MAG: ornithine cyclodeaminase family protein [Variovorax sp.]